MRGAVVATSRPRWWPHPGHFGGLAAPEGMARAQRSVHSLPTDQGKDFPARGHLLRCFPGPEGHRGGAACCGEAARLALLVLSELQLAPALLLGAMRRGKRLRALLPTPPPSGI